MSLFASRSKYERSHQKRHTQEWEVTPKTHTRMRGHAKKDTIKNEKSHQKRHTQDPNMRGTPKKTHTRMRGHTKKDTH